MMQPTATILALPTSTVPLLTHAAPQPTPQAGYLTVLNLDLDNAFVAPLARTPTGAQWIKTLATWIDAVHALPHPPLSIFSRIFFDNSHRPEINKDTPWAAKVPVPGKIDLSEGSKLAQVYPKFKVRPDLGNVEVHKARYYAGAGNELKEILRAQGIDTVVLSGTTTSGVILATAYRLFDLDYRVILISETVLELPGPNAAGMDKVIKMNILPGLPMEVITLEQAQGALNRSSADC